MKSFLEYVAEDILSKYGNQLNRVAVVFPNKRASLFLNEHLARMAAKPIWSPAYITISDLFRQHAQLQVADPIKLVCALHHCFTEQTGIDETLDHFYGWGQLLLADFDDIDKNMADADKVFANLRDLHEFDSVSYLSDEQKAAIRRFFSHFADDHNSLLKERFLKLWSRMGNIYHSFNQLLFSEQVAYEGALYRRVAEDSDIEFKYDHYLFVGFNMLQRVEQQLFTTLKKQGKAHFYWDFDDYYMPHDGKTDNEAGHFIAQYLADYPNELDNHDADIYQCFSQPKHISYVSAPTENIQARYISTWLQQQQRYADGRRTAIVLCDEGLLQTALHCLPDVVEKVNITTGYPLAQAPVAALISQLFALQTAGYAASRDCFRLHHINAVLRHPYSPFISPELPRLQRELNDNKTYYPDRQQLSVDEGATLLFGTRTDNHAQLLEWMCRIVQLIAQQAHLDDPLFQESLFRAYTLLNRLKELVASGELAVDIITLQRLTAMLIQSTSIPFHGEPAEGLQVMGVLETRNIDFDHVLLLSCNEGNIPKGVTDTSFIPYSLRKAYGLTTIDHKVSIYSYYFHRLLQRAHDVTILYNNATTDGQTGEMSRFMLQLMVESPHPVQFFTLRAGQSLTLAKLPTIEKTDEVLQRMLNRFAQDRQQEPKQNVPLLTPTAINRYMRCPLQFYYNYVCGLREPDANDEDAIDNRIFGNIFHEASRLIYEKLSGRSHQVLPRDIQDMLNKKVDIERAVDQAMQTELFRLRSQKNGSPASMPPLNGLQLINREVILHYLRLLLAQDKQLAPFSIIGLECDVLAPMTVSNTHFSFTTTIGGRIDRLDQVVETDAESLRTERIRVVDYKTGSNRPAPLADAEAIFLPSSLQRHSDYYLQALLYAALVSHSPHYNKSQLPVSPALLFIQHAAADPVLYFGKERINDVNDCLPVFGKLLREKIEEIFNPDIAFAPTANRDLCRTCPYKELCHK